MRSEVQRCPNCNATLPASFGGPVQCTYCNAVIQASQPRSSGLQAAPRKSRLGLVIVGIVMATIVGIAAVVAVIVFKVNDSVQQGQQEAEAKRQQVIHRSDQIQREALDRVDKLQRAALDQAEEATRRAMAAKREALDQVARDRARGSGRTAEAGDRAEAPGPDLSLPEQPDRDAVVGKLKAVDVSSCRGDFAITFTIRVRPDGTTGAPTMGPMRANNADITCVRDAITSLEFPKSQRGLALRHELRGGKFK